MEIKVIKRNDGLNKILLRSHPSFVPDGKTVSLIIDDEDLAHLADILATATTAKAQENDYLEAHVEFGEASLYGNFKQAHE